MNSVAVKKFHTGQVVSTVSQNDAFNVRTHTAEPDSTSDIVSVTADEDEEMLTRFGVKSRGYSAKVEINVTAGRPTFRHIVLEGTGLVMGARSEAVE